MRSAPVRLFPPPEMGEGPDGPAPTPSRQGEGGGEGGRKGAKAQGGEGKIEHCMALS